MLIVTYSTNGKQGKGTTKNVHGIDVGWKAKANKKEADDDNDDGPMVQYGGIVNDDETDEVIEAAM
jgi:hypothetical protein